MRLDEGIEKFLEDLETQGRSKFTLTHYRAHLRRFARWLECRDRPSDRSGGDSPLNLDLKKIQVTIRFRKSSSPYFNEAARIAKELPGYRSVESTMHEVTVPRALEDLELWERVKKLADVVGLWKRSEVVLEGAPVENLWELEDSLGEVRRCFARRGGGELGDEYCSGKEAPDDEVRAFGCRLLSGVSCDLQGFQGSEKWFQFGKLSKDLSTFTPDKELIFRTVARVWVSHPRRRLSFRQRHSAHTHFREHLSLKPSSGLLGRNRPQVLPGRFAQDRRSLTFALKASQCEKGQFLRSKRAG